jgi:hypothetical protein
MKDISGNTLSDMQVRQMLGRQRIVRQVMPLAQAAFIAEDLKSRRITVRVRGVVRWMRMIFGK